MANHWFKFYGAEYLSDPKMLALSAPERSCWITLLSYASLSDGVVKFLSLEKLLAQSGILMGTEEWKNTLKVLDNFEYLGMVTISNGVITIRNWEKRQLSESVKRVRDFRRRQSVTKRNGSVTTEENRIEENRRDKNRIEKKRENTPTPSDQAKSFFSLDEVYKNFLEEFSKGRDAPTLEKEFQKFILYWTEPNKSGTKQRWEQENTFEVKRRLVTWLERSNNYSQGNKKITKII
jgi:hypothetical protein